MHLWLGAARLLTHQIEVDGEADGTPYRVSSNIIAGRSLD